MADEQVIDLDLKEESFKVKMKGEVKTFLIRELDGAARDEYFHGMRHRGSMMVNGESEVDDMRGAQAAFLANCLYEVTAEGTLRLLTSEEIQKFPAKHVNSWHEKAQILSGLGEQGEKEAKND